MTFFFNLLTRDFLRRLSNHTPTLAAAEAEVGMRVAQRWNSTANLSNQSPTNAAVGPTCACYLGRMKLKEDQQRRSACAVAMLDLKKTAESPGMSPDLMQPADNPQSEDISGNGTLNYQGKLLY